MTIPHIPELVMMIIWMQFMIFGLDWLISSLETATTWWHLKNIDKIPTIHKSVDTHSLFTHLPKIDSERN